MNLKNIILDYYSNKKDMQLATVGNGQPWLSTVYFTHDENLNLYWTSSRSRRHSLEILLNSKAAVTIVLDNERKQALQMTGTAHEVEVDDLTRVHELYQAKYGFKDYSLEDIAEKTEDGRSYWVFKPTSIALWDEVNFPDSPKQHYEL